MSTHGPTAIGLDSGAMLALIHTEVLKILADKGESWAGPFGPETRFLDGGLPFDSLDLATLLVALEQLTGTDPFRAGFRQFTTAGELATLYGEAAAG
ncbi:acyl carrier protein [Nitrospirillum sp. BR 11828]|uniref:acyl carrier protein n=1 Tax=Nitrospirillum sp. BR 11828 TaxID=3104325 RepID=UPI002ACA6DD3|nr:acyl carrier protein [Nitrospirillum sp. BR 11828]MDZ5649197.1 acyl carrier protein [Nitrospirillum sp. BR 11828]